MRTTGEIVAVATVGLLVVLTVVAAVIFIAAIAMAETCLTMTVQPDQVLGNYDGDTFTVSLGAMGKMAVRVEGVDTPERNTKEPGWEQARAFTAAWLAAGPFDLSTCGKPTLDRITAKVSRNGRTLAQDLIDVGLTK